MGPWASETAAGAEGGTAGEEGAAFGGRPGGLDAPGAPWVPGVPLVEADGDGVADGDGPLFPCADGDGPLFQCFDGAPLDVVVVTGAGPGRSYPYAIGTTPITSQHTATGPSARHRSARVRASRSPGVTG
ncbi:hypothetical protein ABZ957_02385 [Streptomyces sp. NPDC046316]|uniref:hypothetical protein n=1 Tax=Streptomyces sp. NPDC046316 TaxID=3154494 RepID=UPI0033F2218D